MSVDVENAAPPGRFAFLTGNAYSLLLLTMLCWGANAVAAKLAVGLVSPMVLVSSRWLGVMLLLLLLARRSLIEDWPVLKRHLPFLFAMGMLGFTTFNALFYFSAHTTSAINLGIIQGSVPGFVLLGALLLYRTPVSLLQLAGVLVTMVGVAMVAIRGELDNLRTLAFAEGDLLMVVACLIYGGFTVLLRRRPAVSALGFFTIMALAAFLGTLPLVGAEMLAGDDLWPTTWEGMAMVGFVALFPSFISQISFFRAVALIGPGRAGVFVNLVPVFAAILAVLVLHEPFQLYHALALALVLGGIYLAERGKRA